MDIFFDLDGTLTDPKEGITSCIRYALERLGFKVPTADELEWCIGPPLLESLEALVGVAQAEQALALYRERFSAVGWHENRVYCGIEECLDGLVARGNALYLATSKPHVYAQRILDHFQLSARFTSVFGAELDGTRSDKTELLRHALRIVQPTGEAVMIGDRRHDVVGALNNQLRAIGVTYGYGSKDELLEAGAQETVDYPSELLSRL